MKRTDAKMFADLRHTLDDLKRFEATLENKMDGMSRVEYVQEYKKEKRLALLDKYVPQRKCVLCNELKIKSRQWVIIPPDMIRRCEHYLKTHDVQKTVQIIIRVSCAKRVICRACYRRYIEQLII